jgi:hypothetical protein
VLKRYQGKLIGDRGRSFNRSGYEATRKSRSRPGWVHARRKIDECRGAFPVQLAGLESLIRNLYDIEDQIKMANDDERLRNA